jgi:hypothetical protein
MPPRPGPLCALSTTSNFSNEATVIDMTQFAATIGAIASKGAGLFVKGTVAIAAGACILWAFPMEKGVLSEPETASARGQLVVTGNGRRVRITAGVADADTASEIYLTDDENRSLITLQLFENGIVAYRQGGDPFSVGYRKPDGTVGFSVGDGRNRCRIEVEADGKFVVEVWDLNRRLLRSFRIDANAAFVNETLTEAN